MGYVLKEDVVKRCEAIKAIAEKQIKEWQEHTLEYKEKVSCQEAFDREREMRDMLMFLEDLPDENVREDIQAYWIFDDFDGDGLDYQCSFCHSFSRDSWDYCPFCGAYMKAIENPAVEEHPTVDWCRKCANRYGSAACVDCYDVYKYFSDGTPPVELNPSNYMPKEYPI